MPLIPGLQAWHVAQKALDILLSFCVTFFFWMSGIFKATLFYVTFFFSILPSSHFHCLFVSRELLKPMDFFFGGVHLIPWECSRGLSHLELSGHLYAKLEFRSISLLALPATLGSLVLTAESPDGGWGGGAAQCKRYLASSTLHSP